MKKKIYLASPHMSKEGYEKQFIEEAFQTNWLSTVGENINQLEIEMKQYMNINAAVALSSGTAAIHLGLKALNVGKGDIVFVSDLTFVASVNPIIYLNAIPVLIDSEPDTWNMSPIALQKAFKKYQPKAVILVHLYGQVGNLEEIMKICKQHQVPVLEDAAESLGTTYRGKLTGTFGELGALSFNGNKIITTTSGGMLISHHTEMLEKVRFWSTQAKDPAPYYEHSQIGYNYRMSNVLAGIGRGQLKVLEERIRQKRKIFEIYQKAFEDLPEIEMLTESKEVQSNYWLSVMTIKKEARVKPLEVVNALEKENIEARLVWKPMHLQPLMKPYAFFQHNDATEKSVSEDLFTRGVCLPSDTKNTEEDMERIIQIIKTCFNK